MNLTKAFSGGNPASTLGMLQPWESQEGAHTPSGSKTPIVICGWLSKMKREQRKFRSTWNQRWFTVEDGALHWYKTPSSDACGRISLTDIQGVRKLNGGGKGGEAQGNFVFVVRGINRDMLLRAESANDESRWIRGLTLQIDLVHGGTFQGPPSNKNRRRSANASRLAAAGAVAATLGVTERNHFIDINGGVRTMVDERQDGSTGRTEDTMESSDAHPQRWKARDKPPGPFSYQTSAPPFRTVKMIPRDPRGISTSLRRRPLLMSMSFSPSTTTKAPGETGAGGCGGGCGEVQGSGGGGSGGGVTRRRRGSSRIVPVFSSPKSRVDDACLHAETRGEDRSESDDERRQNGISADGDSGGTFVDARVDQTSKQHQTQHQQSQPQPPLPLARPLVNGRDSRPGSPRTVGSGGAAHELAHDDTSDPEGKLDSERGRGGDYEDGCCWGKGLENGGTRGWEGGHERMVRRSISTMDGDRRVPSSRPRRHADHGKGRREEAGDGSSSSGGKVRQPSKACRQPEGSGSPTKAGAHDGSEPRSRHDCYQDRLDGEVEGDACSSSERSAATIGNPFAEHESFSVQTPRWADHVNKNNNSICSHRRRRCSDWGPTSCTPSASLPQGKKNLGDERTRCFGGNYFDGRRNLDGEGKNFANGRKYDEKRQKITEKRRSFDDDDDEDDDYNDQEEATTRGGISAAKASFWLRAGEDASSAPRGSRSASSVTAEDSWSARMVKRSFLDDDTLSTSKLGSSGRSSSRSGYQRPSRRYLVQQAQNRKDC